MGTEQTRHDVVVVGGGIAGLSCAWKLCRAGLDVVVLEAADEPGGNVRTVVVDGWRMERGPHTLLSSADAVFDLVDEVGLGDQLVPTLPTAEARFVARHGRLHAMPTTARSFLSTGLLSWPAKLMLATEPIRLSRGQPDDTAATFFTRRFGAEAARVLAGAFISGVYAGDPERLSAAAAFPLFWGFEQQTGSMILGAMRYYRRRAAERRAQGRPARKGLFSMRQGLGQLSAGVASALGQRCRTGTPVHSLTRVDELWEVVAEGSAARAPALVLAVPPAEAARLLQGLDPALSELLAAIPLAPVVTVQLGFAERVEQVPDGFGFLVPRGEEVRTLGVLFPSRLFEGRAPAGGDLLTGFVGGSTDPQALDLDDQALAGIVLGDLERLCGVDRAPDFVQVRRYPAAIPQLTVGHLDRMAQVQRHLDALDGLALSGNYLFGVGLKDAVRSGFETAEALIARHGEEP